MQATESNVNFIVADGLSIDDVTKEAFQLLGNGGVMSGSMEHSCDECTQRYRERSAVISNIDPSAIVGMEDTPDVPQLQTNIVDNCAPVKMIVVDGIVTGHTVSHYLELIVVVIFITMVVLWLPRLS